MSEIVPVRARNSRAPARISSSRATLALWASCSQFALAMQGRELLECKLPRGGRRQTQGLLDLSSVFGAAVGMLCERGWNGSLESSVAQFGKLPGS